MSQPDFQEQIKEWPTEPGVYLMRDSSHRILYVGKAKNLKNRIRSYFQKAESLTAKTRILMKRVVSIEFQVTQTELEALLLECNLIKKHRPRYNIRLKDDKNYPYVVLDFSHPFPQFRTTRKLSNHAHLRYFGPYSGGVKEIGRFVLKTFQIRDCSDSKFKNRTRPCLNYEIGICTAPCVDYVSEQDYSKQIQEAILFLKGKKRELLSELKRQMLEASDKLEFERARNLRDKIQAVEKITEKQGAILTEKQEDIDILGVYPGEGELSIAVLFIRSGLLIGRRVEKVPLTLDSADETIRTFLEQFYTVSLIPSEVWLAQDFPDRLSVEEFLTHRAEHSVKVRIPKTEKPLRLLGMAYENAKLIYQSAHKKSEKSASEQLQEVLNLSEIPHSIEGVDCSNIQGTNPAVALVHFSDERPLKSHYRIYYPKTVEGPNDFAMIYETVLRRLSKPDHPPPDLLLIDGGKGQLQSALKAIDELKINIPVCSLAKSRTESAFTRKEIEKSEERIFVPNRKNPIILKEGHPALRLLQQVRDEAHRFSVKSHQTRRKNKMMNESLLLETKGIGPKTREKLLKHYGNLEKLSQTSVEDLEKLGLSEKNALSLLEKLYKINRNTNKNLHSEEE
ncbi:MAG: excinuclease ABC subunit UvrC [Deltaproteobacteria bacterium]|nr:excinuclease ABC subunit UvrC [Deltaproteobacteria bacterium]